MTFARPLQLLLASRALRLSSEEAVEPAVLGGAPLLPLPAEGGGGGLALNETAAAFRGERAPVLCTEDEMERLGAELNLTVARMRQAQGSLAEGPQAQRRCARSRILPAYVDAPPLPGIPEFQPFALPSEGGGGAGGAIQGEDGLTMFDAGPPVDPGLFRYDASESRFEKRGQEDFPDWKRTIEQSRKGFYCYVWRSGYRLQDKLTNENICFPDEIKERFKRAPTCALLAHSFDFEQLATYAWEKGGGKRSAIQEEIDGHDLVIRFKDQSIGDGAFGRKTNYRVYSKVGSGLQRVPHRDRTFEKAMMERRNQNVSDGLVVLWNQDYDKCKDRLEMEAWFAKEAERSGVPLYTFNPDDLRTLVKGWYEFAQHDEAIKDCIWNDRENKDSFCYRVFHRRYPVSTKQGTGCRTPTTGFGGALAFLNVCSTISLYGYSSYPMPPRGDMNYHKTSLAEQTLLLKVLSDSVDGLAKKSDPKNFTHIHRLKGMQDYFAGKDPEEFCKDETLADEWRERQDTANGEEIPSYGFWGH